MVNSERSYLLPATILIVLVCRILSYTWGLSVDIPLQETVDLWGTIPFLWQTIATFGVALGLSFLAVRFSTYYLLLQDGAFRPLVFYLLLLLGTQQAFFSLKPFTFLILLLLGLYFSLFGTYNRESAPHKALNMGLSIGASTLLWSPFLLLMPFVLLQFYSMKSLSPRNLIAFFLGLFLPLWIFVPFLLLPDVEDYAISNMNLMKEWGFSYSFGRASGFSWLYPVLLLSLYLISFAHLQLSYTAEKVVGRNYLFALSSVGFYLLILSAVMPAATEGLLYLSVLPISILAARLLTKQKRRMANLLAMLSAFAFLASFLLSVFF